MDVRDTMTRGQSQTLKLGLVQRPENDLEEDSRMSP